MDLNASFNRWPCHFFMDLTVICGEYVYAPDSVCGKCMLMGRKKAPKPTDSLTLPSITAQSAAPTSLTLPSIDVAPSSLAVGAQRSNPRNSNPWMPPPPLPPRHPLDANYSAMLEASLRALSKGPSLSDAHSWAEPQKQDADAGGGGSTSPSLYRSQYKSLADTGGSLSSPPLFQTLSVDPPRQPFVSKRSAADDNYLAVLESSLNALKRGPSSLFNDDSWAKRQKQDADVGGPTSAALLYKPLPDLPPLRPPLNHTYPEPLSHRPMQSLTLTDDDLYDPPRKEKAEEAEASSKDKGKGKGKGKGKAVDDDTYDPSRPIAWDLASDSDSGGDMSMSDYRALLPPTPAPPILRWGLATIPEYAPLAKTHWGLKDTKMVSSKKTPAKPGKSSAAQVHRSGGKSPSPSPFAPPVTPKRATTNTAAAATTGSQKKKGASAQKEWNFTHLPIKQEERKKNGRVEGRNLITWNRPRMAEKVLLHIQYECARRSIELPWDAIAHRLHPGSTGGAVQQHLVRLRSALVAEGHLVPPVSAKHNARVVAPVNHDIRGFVRAHPDGVDKTSVREVRWDEPMDDLKWNLPDAGDFPPSAPASPLGKRAAAATFYDDDDEQEEGADDDDMAVDEDDHMVVRKFVPAGHSAKRARRMAAPARHVAGSHRCESAKKKPASAVKREKADTDTDTDTHCELLWETQVSPSLGRRRSAAVVQSHSQSLSHMTSSSSDSATAHMGSLKEGYQRGSDDESVVIADDLDGDDDDDDDDMELPVLPRRRNLVSPPVAAAAYKGHKSKKSKSKHAASSRRAAAAVTAAPAATPAAPIDANLAMLSNIAPQLANLVQQLSSANGLANLLSGAGTSPAAPTPSVTAAEPKQQQKQKDDSPAAPAVVDDAGTDAAADGDQPATPAHRQEKRASSSKSSNSVGAQKDDDFFQVLPVTLPAVAVAKKKGTSNSGATTEEDLPSSSDPAMPAPVAVHVEEDLAANIGNGDERFGWGVPAHGGEEMAEEEQEHSGFFWEMLYGTEPHGLVERGEFDDGKGLYY
ncbi:hypothetical protein B0T26DRAFT_875713 [Lasiosphaeria miniovina]|uniref:Uncharacterized protein n=1 Tax=Lasiosphaeria miniovina TaxID=1954250 RepID=A0AA40DNQ0_9PEZI|nr:uncharacterized protein B0T26DRAFT_875713 [Lasiosphaeria miniovina]KAK0706563.1 hypothetical protein B0T26DRAFT_875713 [Lasiosphaeria miniovina]